MVIFDNRSPITLRITHGPVNWIPLARMPPNSNRGPFQIEDPSCFRLATHYGLDTSPPSDGYQTTETTPGIGAQ